MSLAIAIFMATLFFVGVIVGVGLTALLRSAAYNDGYAEGFADASESPPYLLSRDTCGPSDDLAPLLYERNHR